MLEPGTLLAGKYRIDRVLGQGGMGVVVEATHVYLAQRVALKFLLPQFLHDQPTVERFLREARASAALRGEHVCRVSDVGTLETGSPYIVMELLEGSDLATMLGRTGQLPIEVASYYILQACVGLAEAHGLGIVHRDLKPANLFVTRRPDGTPLMKVLDFGIAKAQHDAAFHLTQTQSVLGSPGYMSPEQLRSTRDADVRSDIWALGIILYELVSGRPPFVAESITELALRVAMDPLPPLVAAGTTGFDSVVARCLEKEPARRFQDVAALAQALVPFGGAQARDLALAAARVLGPGAVAAPAQVAAVAAAPTTLSSSVGSATAARTRVRWGVVAGVAGLAITMAVVVAALHGLGGGDRVPAAPVVAEPPPSQPTNAAVAAPTAAAQQRGPASPTVPPAAPSSPPIESPGPAQAAPPSPVAHTASEPLTVDAGVTVAAPAVDAGAAKKPRPKPRPTSRPAEPTEDVGASRY